MGYMGEQSHLAKIAETIIPKGIMAAFGDSLIPEQQQTDG
jgi:hypothetical protein